MATRIRRIVRELHELARTRTGLLQAAGAWIDEEYSEGRVRQLALQAREGGRSLRPSAHLITPPSSGRDARFHRLEALGLDLRRELLSVDARAIDDSDPLVSRAMLFCCLAADQYAGEYLIGVTTLAELAWEETDQAELGRSYVTDHDLILEGQPPWGWAIPLVVQAFRLRAQTILAEVDQGSSGNGAECGLRSATEVRRVSESGTPLLPDGTPKCKPGGYTAKELRDEADEAGEPVSEERFRMIRIAAGLEASPEGSAGQYRRFANAQILKLAEAAERGSFRHRKTIAEAWRALIRNDQ